MEDTTTFIEQVLELLSQKKLTELRELISSEEPADIAAIFDELDAEQAIILFRLLPKETGAEVFVEMDSDTQEYLINSFNDTELASIINELYNDDTVDLIEDMPANVVKRILAAVGSEDRKQINELLNYPDNSAGSIMTTEFVRLKKSMTVKEAFAYLRKVALMKETVYNCYVTDEKSILIGIVTVKTLLTEDQDAVIGDIMDENVIYVSTPDDREETAMMFARYDFIALPVVDREHHLVGIITVDDVLDVISEETEEDFAKMAAITPTDTPYLKTSPLKIWLARIPWLLLLMVSATFTGMIISSFESALASVVILTAFIPMIMDSGGNSGSQASVTVIRGLSTGEIEFGDIFRVFFKEFRVSLLCGISLGAAAVGKVMLVDRLLMHNSDVTFTVALTVGLTLFLSVMCAKLIGCSLPMLAKKIGFDPAVMASPFITTIVDAVSLLIYFGIATALIPGLS